MNTQTENKHSNAQSEEIIALHQQINNLSILAKFPQVNPNIVFNIDRHNRIDFYNPAAQAWLVKHGLENSDDLLQLLPEEVVQKLNCKRCSLKKVLAGESTFKDEAHNYSISKFPEHLLFFVELIDISEQKRIQRLREDTERIIQHDLKTPLNAIIGFSQLLLSDDLKEQHIEDVQTIYNSGLELQELIESSLDLFKMEEKSYQLQLNRFDLLKLIRDLSQKLTQVYQVKFEIYLDHKLVTDESDFFITAEQKHIRSVFNNLLKNAIEASPKNEQITLKLSNQNAQHLISITNKGEIPEKLRTTFFEKYATQGKQSGTGLGTYSAKLIIDSHDGDLNFRSGKGETDLYIKLPMIAAI